MYIHIHVHLYMLTYACIYIHIRTYADAHTFIQIQVHTQSWNIASIDWCNWPCTTAHCESWEVSLLIQISVFTYPHYAPIHAHANVSHLYMSACVCIQTHADIYTWLTYRRYRHTCRHGPIHSHVCMGTRVGACAFIPWYGKKLQRWKCHRMMLLKTVFQHAFSVGVASMVPAMLFLCPHVCLSFSRAVEFACWNAKVGLLPIPRYRIWKVTDHGAFFRSLDVEKQ